MIVEVSLEDVRKCAKEEGLEFHISEFIDEDVEVSDLLPNSESEELWEKELKGSSEDAYNYAAMEYFDQWDWSYNGDTSKTSISSFCNSIQDKLILGKYLSDRKIPYATLVK